jgi:hypothetical protein
MQLDRSQKKRFLVYAGIGLIVSGIVLATLLYVVVYHQRLDSDKIGKSSSLHKLMITGKLGMALFAEIPDVTAHLTGT